MASIEWDDIEPSKKGKAGGQGKFGKDDGKFMRLGANQSYQVRPVLKPVRFWKLYNEKDGKLRSAIIDDPDKSSVCATHPKLSRQKRYAVLVIDRTDGKLKILEGPNSMFNNFKAFKKATSEDPGGPNGGDWKIDVNSPSGKKDRETTYDVEFLNKVALTESEKQFIREHLKEDFNLEEIFKCQTDEEAEKRLFGDWTPRNAGGSAPAAPVAANANTTNVTSSKSSNDDFNF